MKLIGTKFQLKVWAYLRKIPRGSVKTYSQVAKAIGKPLAIRAVANAIGKNPYRRKFLAIELLDLMGRLEVIQAKEV